MFTYLATLLSIIILKNHLLIYVTKEHLFSIISIPLNAVYVYVFLLMMFGLCLVLIFIVVSLISWCKI